MSWLHGLPSCLAPRMLRDRLKQPAVCKWAGVWCQTSGHRAPSACRGAIPSSWWDDALSTKQLGPKVPEFLYLADNAFSGTGACGKPAARWLFASSSPACVCVKQWLWVGCHDNGRPSVIVEHLFFSPCAACSAAGLGCRVHSRRHNSVQVRRLLAQEPECPLLAVPATALCCLVQPPPDTFFGLELVPTFTCLSPFLACRHEAVADSREIAELQARLASHGRVRMVELIKTRDAYVTV